MGRRLDKFMAGEKNHLESAPAMDEGWWDSILAEEGRFAAPLPPPKLVKEDEKEKEKEKEKPKPNVDWESALQLYRADQIVTLKVVGYNRGGLLVEGEGLAGFVPCSHLVDLPAQPEANRRDDCLAAYDGRALRLKIIECVPEESRMVFSERAARAEPGKRTVLFGSLQTGQTVEGDVTNVTDFGVFVDLGGVEGLIHISELSWGRVMHPRQILDIGQRVNVLVLGVLPERCRVALSLKRLHPNPWEKAEQRYPVNSVVPAQVTALVPYGAFARLEEGLEGLIHVSEIPLPPSSAVKDILAPGQEIAVRVIQVDAPRQRLGLSMKVNQ
jgi:small subunit ribosomal protein S1